MKGSYILLIELPEEQTITLGSLKSIHFVQGYYAYVGSAMSGLEARLNRHLRSDKNLHWHIDYLLQKAHIDDIIVCENEERLECRIAGAIGSQFDDIPGFGCSDCRCPSHLFFATEGMKQGIMAMLDSMGMEPRLLENLEPGVDITE